MNDRKLYNLCCPIHSTVIEHGEGHEYWGNCEGIVFLLSYFSIAECFTDQLLREMFARGEM